MDEYSSVPVVSYHILDYVPIGICVFDRDYKIIFWNRCLAHWTRTSTLEMVGFCLAEKFETFFSRGFCERIAPVFDGGPPVLFSSHLYGNVIPCTLSDGSSMVQKTVVSAIPSPTPGEFHALMAIENTTELSRKIFEYRVLRNQAMEEVLLRKKIEEELKTSNQTLMEQQDVILQKERLNVLLEMSGTMAHELNQPLMILMGSIELIQMSQELTEENLKYLSHIEKSAGRMADIVSKIQEIKQYQTKKYLNGVSIIDLEKSSNPPSDPGMDEE